MLTYIFQTHTPLGEKLKFEEKTTMLRTYENMAQF